MQLLDMGGRQQEGRYIIEDDYDSEFRYKGKPIPALQGYDQRTERVIYIGTFSKSIAPAIRVSYLVLPEKLTAGAVQRAGHGFFLHGLAGGSADRGRLSWMDGYYERHLNKMRAVYKGAP